VQAGWARWRKQLGVILKTEGSVVEPAIGMTFDSLGEAYDFYNLYSWEHGFGVRYGKSRLNPEKTDNAGDSMWLLGESLLTSMNLFF
jgi:hypothetical protein